MSDDHGHGHGHGASEENPWAGQGSVVLDIGGDVGALIVEMPAEMVGVEIEIRSLAVPREGHHPHVAVVARLVPSGERIPTLVYPELLKGDYELYEKGTAEKGRGGVEMTAHVDGGAITELQWPALTQADGVGGPSAARAVDV